jgi:C-terminal processing protease CtpA/Prc
MKKIIYITLLTVLASACAGPKYTMSFYRYDKPEQKQVAEKPAVSEMPEAAPVLASAATVAVDLKASPRAAESKNYLQMSKSERKVVRQQLKSDIKSYVKEHRKHLKVESVQATQAMDHDLKMAAIFGAIGIVLGAFYSASNIIGFIGFVAIVIALIFLIKWLVRQ